VVNCLTIHSSHLEQPGGRNALIVLLLVREQSVRGVCVMRVADDLTAECQPNGTSQQQTPKPNQPRTPAAAGAAWSAGSIQANTDMIYTGGE
jgi:hypothetical protein